MDEILIEEKKYVSSKRAAEMTGYAKDYVGQLCREGRVPARLIGRSWYVLDAAIQDHRFGSVVNEPKETVKAAKSEETSKFPSTWESPRYESPSEDELLPSINQLKDSDSDSDDESAGEQENGSEVSQHIQDSWRAWFDRFDKAENTPETVAQVTHEEPKNVEKERKADEEDEDIVKVPIHTISRPLYQPPPEEFLPRNLSAEGEKGSPKRRKGSRWTIKTIQMAGVVLAVIAATTAVIGSGYFDEYIISSSPVRMMAGVGLYNK